MSNFTFNDENLKKFEELKLRYPKIDSLTLPCLWMAQYQEKYISREAMIYIANLLSMSPAQIYAVASFYTMFKLSPIGEHHIEVCKTLSCKLCGKDELLKHLKDKYNLEPGQTSADGKYTLSLVECMGACGGAPMMTIDEVYHESVNTKTIDTLLGEIQ
jgi:NADH-quinone oxidoreductase subunit E